jgi:putative ABC transport system permease protein
LKQKIPVAWLQLSKEKVRLTIALAGVAFAVILVSMQLGFQSSMYVSAVRYHNLFQYDLVMLSPSTPFIGYPDSFSRRRLIQSLAMDGVEAVTPVYMQQAQWKNPWQHNSRGLLVIGFDPSHDVLAIGGVQQNLNLLKLQDTALFDAASRPEFGPVAAQFQQQGEVVAEVNDRRIRVPALFRLGSSFGIDGSLVTSDLNYQRIFPDRPPGFIELGLIHLRDNADPVAVRQVLVAALEQDVKILTRQEFIDRELEYWRTTTPIGYVFGFGAIMGLIVGCVIVYQILFADVSEHQAEYSTLKAMGYKNSSLSWIVLNEAAILAVLGYLPGLLITFGLYHVMAEATSLPIEMTLGRGLTVLFMTLGMCGISGLLALRKVRSTDPAEVFT